MKARADLVGRRVRFNAIVVGAEGYETHLKEGVVKEVNDKGMLVVDADDGTKHVLYQGQVYPIKEPS
jgi:GTPase